MALACPQVLDFRLVQDEFANREVKIPLPT
jgi:hypothetical protein